MKIYFIRDESPKGVKYTENNPDNKLSVREFEVTKKNGIYRGVNGEGHSANLEEEVLVSFINDYLYVWTTDPTRIELMKKKLFFHKIMKREESIIILHNEIEQLKKQLLNLNS
jgi:hypothetical protein